ncbi:prophage ps3 protein 01 [Campylobacter hyointestinalis subsp. hyointestinalis]|uniref:Prophage ps3 protein 01 n=1 Tax=Campylobacter hyointestinalis subsp. hyointestinalis TaxID=91352 RepID=A0A9W5ESP9_CAMHY|nr:type II toxin-antitoxin system antitoxin SocA domain-containing protein [Campylobacter hyointestinalis]CUU81843.1 prophage ps3 protein 01 [Campylobacter hyointestinalis subsp. hyointestinalis]
MTTISAIDTAKLALALLKNSDDEIIEYTSRLKLLKLLYYIQGYHLAMFDAPLFNDKIEAWLHGPVVPSVYQWAKNITDEKMQDEAMNDEQMGALNLHPQQTKLISEVLNIYNKYSAYGLRDKTHTEMPWLSVYEKDKNNEITQDSLKNFFIPLVEK